MILLGHSTFIFLLKTLLVLLTPKITIICGEINSISSILKGEITKSMEEEMAMEEIAKTVNTSIAEVNRLLDGSNDILVNAEIEGSINSGKADKILAEFDKKGFAIFDAPVNDVALGMANSGTEQPVYVISKPNENTNEKTYF